MTIHEKSSGFGQKKQIFDTSETEWFILKIMNRLKRLDVTTYSTLNIITLLLASCERTVVWLSFKRCWSVDFSLDFFVKDFLRRSKGRVTWCSFSSAANREQQRLTLSGYQHGAEVQQRTFNNWWLLSLSAALTVTHTQATSFSIVVARVVARWDNKQVTWPLLSADFSLFKE